MKFNNEPLGENVIQTKGIKLTGKFKISLINLLLDII
jgi:hypothetical protein